MKRTIVASALTLLVFAACRNNESPASDTGPVATASTDSAATATTETTLTSTAGTDAPPASTSLSAADQEFVAKAAKTGMAEVQLATNVTQRATSPDVKAFANQMITDHNASNSELTTLAASKGVTPPADIDPDKKALDAELAKLTGPELDRKYMEAMVKDHVAAAAEFEKAAQQLTDPDLKAWAAKTLPTLHAHHHSAEAIVAKLK
jgi:putative membrane protein